jgi:hypothetical protein
VSDRTAPALLRTSALEGSLTTARLVGGYAYVAVSSAARLPSNPAQQPAEDDVMPMVWRTDGAAEPIALCSNVSYLPDVQPRSLLTVASVALSPPSASAHAPGELVDRHTVATGSAWRGASVLATASSLYFASYNSDWVCDTSSGSSGCAATDWWCVDRRRLRHAAWWSESCTFSVATYIVAFSLGAHGALTERAKGAVPGYLLSQWALDEHNGFLRVAYTRPAGANGAGTTTTDNGVDVLDASNLTRVGRVRGLVSAAAHVRAVERGSRTKLVTRQDAGRELVRSPTHVPVLTCACVCAYVRVRVCVCACVRACLQGSGERIYAMRFMGNLGFMVTFRQVDPLYALQLTDPTNPRVTGELKIPGYSDYLHPVDDTTLLGIGQAGDDNGVLRGVKLALFNISDLANPRQGASVELGGSSSTTLVSDDHKVRCQRVIWLDLAWLVSQGAAPSRPAAQPPSRIPSRLAALRTMLVLAARPHSRTQSHRHSRRHLHTCDAALTLVLQALLFDRTRRLLVLPITERSGRWGGWDCDALPTFHGAKAFTIDNGVFTLRAAIEHGPNRSHMHSWAQHTARQYQCAQDACAAATVRRSLYVGDDLYTLSDNELRATSLTSYTEVWRTALHQPEVLAAEGTCTLDGAPLPWLRVAASGDDIWCDSRYGRTCDPADPALSQRTCSSAGSRSFDALLNNAIAPCGNLSCVPPENVSYHPCRMWF